MTGGSPSVRVISSYRTFSAQRTFNSIKRASGTVKTISGAWRGEGSRT